MQLLYIVEYSKKHHPLNPLIPISLHRMSLTLASLGISTTITVRIAAQTPDPTLTRISNCGTQAYHGAMRISRGQTRHAAAGER
jgi:hypothetical protein